MRLQFFISSKFNTPFHIFFRNLFGIVLILIILLSSCKTDIKKYDPVLEENLNAAGKNRIELEHVLKYYVNDSLKYKAAVFLIKGMRNKHSLIMKDYDTVVHMFDYIDDFKSSQTGAKTRDYNHDYFRSLIKAKFPVMSNRSFSVMVSYDLENMKAAYLIENIDYAFKAWQLPWARLISFENFCKYILPYRYGNEALLPWRKTYWEKTIKIRASLSKETNVLNVTTVLSDISSLTYSELKTLAPLSNIIPAKDLIRINTASSCSDQTNLGIIIMRGLGIPAARLDVPVWANNISGHNLLGVMFENKWYPFDFAESNPLTFKVPKIHVVPKLYLEEYANSVANKSSSEIINTVDNINYLDVTQYITKTTTVKITTFNQLSVQDVFLCTFNDVNWVPVMKSKFHNKLVRFNQIGTNALYMVCTKNGAQYNPVTHPFFIDQEGRPHVFKTVQKKTRLVLTRKYPVNDRLTKEALKLLGSFFEGSNDILFKKKKVLWKLNDGSFVTNRIKNIDPIAFRYVRFVFANIDSLNTGLAGLKFTSKDEFGKAVEQYGQPISSLKVNPLFFKVVFDNNPLSYLRVYPLSQADFKQYAVGNSIVVPDKSQFWCGINFGKPVKISTLELTSRNDDNYINVDEEYELFHWQDRWISLGKFKAKSTELNIETKVNGLFLLKNLVKGSENRPFTYIDDRIQWF